MEGLGDATLWTEANKTLTVRKRNVSLQVQTPKGQDAQVSMAKTFLGKL